MIRINGVEEEFTNETVAILLQRIGLDGRGIAVAVNGEVVPRSRWHVVTIVDDAAIEIVTAAAGG